MSKPLAVDLYAGLGGWTDGLLAEGWNVIGFDIERHEYWVPESSPESGTGQKGTRPMAKRGWTQGCAVSLGMEGTAAQPRTRKLEYPAQLVVQDVLTLHGSQFRDAALIVASPPCQAYSYMAMPWSLAKAKAAEIRADKSGEMLVDLNRLFDACFRIQREACEAAGRHIPLIVENVRGAQPWVGRARWHYGSFFLWGDVPALMPVVPKRSAMKEGIAHRPDGATNFHRDLDNGRKNNGGSWFNIGSPGQKETNQNPVHELAKVPSLDGGRRTDPGKGARFTSRDCGVEATGIKQPGLSGARENGKGDRWFQDGAAREGSKSPARKAASAMIAKIPLPLSQHIARCYLP